MDSNIAGRFIIAEPAELEAGMKVVITLAKTERKSWPFRPPQRLDFIAICRDGDGWLMHADKWRQPSRVPDDAPCYRDGRMVLVGRA